MKKSLHNFIVALVFILSFSNDSLMRYAIQIFERLPYINIVSDFLPLIIYAILVTLIIPFNLKKIRRIDFIFISIYSLLILYSAALSPFNEFYIVQHLSTVLTLPLYYFLGRILLFNEKIFKISYILSVIAILVNTLYLAYYLNSGRIFSVDSMYESYGLLFNVLVVIGWTINHKNFYGMIISFLGLIYLFSMGTRGPILLTAAFVGVLLISRIKSSWKVRFYVLVTGLIAIISELLFNILNQIAINLSNIIKAFGLSTRIFESFLYGQHTESLVERQIIYESLISLLKEKLYFGYGLYGEYQFIGWSAHNIYIQVIFEFGIFIGILLILLYTYKFIKAIIYSTELERILLFIIFVYVFVQGTYGGNLLSNYVFFSIGLIITIPVDYRTRKMNAEVINENNIVNQST